MLMVLLKKKDYATEISSIKIDYATNTVLTSRLNDLKNTHISDEIKKVDDKVNKNSSDILADESRLKEVIRGNYYYNQQSYLLYEPKSGSFDGRQGNVDGWKSTEIKVTTLIQI